MDASVALISPSPLSRSQIRAWLDHARAVLKGATRSTTTMIDGTLVQAVVSAKKVDGGIAYTIALSRFASEEETRALAEIDFVEDFTIEATQPEAEEVEDERLTVSKAAYDDLCLSLAKERHTEWVNERTSAGWRFGETFSMKAMTHPLLRPWHELPEEHRNVDHGILQKMIDFLDREGYSVVSKIEVESFNKELRIHSIRIDPFTTVRNDEPD